ncbi:hypothetical protein ASG41_22280 [Modestobacter sp. Leaf380]|nr:hypothetical protein ASG41_22280 [Modestobacter sp. Leaf380]
MNAWPFPESPDTLIFTTQPILDGAPVVDVHHDDDGDWQVLCGTTLDPQDARMVHFGHLVEMHPGLVALADLPPAGRPPSAATQVMTVGAGRWRPIRDPFARSAAVRTVLATVPKTAPATASPGWPAWGGAGAAGG